LTVGDPAATSTDLGPVVSARQQRRIWDFIEGGLADGAKLLIGGTGLPAGIDAGWFVKPTVLGDVDNTSTVAREEIFGPVVIIAAEDDDAIRLANDSDYGLAGAVFTRDVARGYEIATRIRSGTFGVNEGYMNDPAVGFGGVKGSGYGRELGPEGFDSYRVTRGISGVESLPLGRSN